MIYIVVKPNIIVNVKDLQNKMEKMTLLTCDNNFHTLATSLKELQQEIMLTKEKTSSRTISFLMSFFALQRS